MPVAVTDEENIAKLREPFAPTALGTVKTTDSVLGVTFDMYSLDGLRASLESQMPDTADNSVVLFFRSSDYLPDSTAIGTLIINGKEISDKRNAHRNGYVAVSAQGKPVIGVSKHKKTSDFIKETGGSFFRQFLLVSDSELPASFRLHGKVERAAIGRMVDDSLYYIVSRDKESMYDFADALREYGFVDAIYITGGNAYSFSRGTDGSVSAPESVKEKIGKYSNRRLAAPLLVFRNK